MYALNLTYLLSITSAILSLILLVMVFPKVKSRRKLPPVPVRTWPLFGNLLSLPENPRQQFKQWHSQHGNLFSLYFGSTLVVVVNGYKSIREILVTKGASFLDRPVMYPNQVIGMEHCGVAFSSGHIWQDTRSATISILKELGVGKNILNEKIQDDIEFLLDRLVQLKGQATDIWHHVHVSISSIICSILVGERFSYEDERFKHNIQFSNQLASCAKELAALNFLPILKYLPGDVLKTNRIREAAGGLKCFAEFCCDVVGASTEKKSFISCFRLKQKEKPANGRAAILDEENLKKTVMDLIGAGTESTSATIAWCILYLQHHPDVQVKIHEELDREIGFTRKPSMGDKLKLPYLEAVIKETQRLASVAPFSIMRVTGEDVTVGNYCIPKGTSVIPNLDSVLHSAEIWGPDVDQFRPTRFLNPDGSVRHSEEFIPFSIGRRNCLGMGLAQMELFLFLAAMFQRFEFVLPEGVGLPTLKENLGLLAVPSHYKVCCVDRFVERI